MAQKITGLRVVLASPTDVRRERESFAKIVERVNNDTARAAGFHLDLWRWETDSRPGFNPMGAQGLIDRVLGIAQCDLFAGIFWNRIGSVTKFGKTGTEHEFDVAYQAWKSARAPEIQRSRVLAFKKAFPEEGFYWRYNGHAEFVKLGSQHLRKFVLEHVARQADRPANPQGDAARTGTRERFTFRSAPTVR